MAAALDTHFDLIMRVMDPAARAEAFARFGKPSLVARISAKALDQVPEGLRSRTYDIVHVARSYLAPFALELVRRTQQRRPLLTLDLDEDDGRVYHGLAALAGRRRDHSRQRWCALEGNAFHQLVEEVAPAFDRVWIASSIDAGRLRSRSHHIQVLPNAVTAAPRLRRRDDGRTLLFVGSLGYEPNQDAVEWLLRDIWPNLKHVPNLKLQIVGRGAPERLRRLGSQRGAQMLGWVENLEACLEASTLTVAPIRQGAGTRIKLLESAMHGVPIVTTPFGAEGLGFCPKHHVWLAEDAAVFANVTADVLAKPGERRRRARLARSYVINKFELKDQVARLSQQLLDAL
jgi:glycosyltransferase involved in cell wall biosynthesis